MTCADCEIMASVVERQALALADLRTLLAEMHDFCERPLAETPKDQIADLRARVAAAIATG